MDNISRFKVKNELFLKYVDEVIEKITKEINSEDRDEVIYISAPMTGVDDYEYRFNQMYDWVKIIFTECNPYIINPSKYIDKIPEELNATYIDKVFFTFELLKLSTIIIIDDSTDKWMESRGCIAELTFANDNDITIYGYDYIVNAMRYRLYIDGFYSNDRSFARIDNEFMEYETKWEG